MARKRKRGKKVRVDFRRNREPRRRESDLTRRYRDDAERDALVDAETSESVRAKGALSRKRTIIVDENEAPLVDEIHWKRGIVTEVHGRICTVRCVRGGAADESAGSGGVVATLPAIDQSDVELWQCTVRRVLRTMLIAQRSGVTVGDEVWFSDQSAHHDGQREGVIERVAPRRTTLSRRDRRKREQAIVANADQLLIVASVARPRLKPHLIDRYLVAAGKGGLRPIVVFNKWDLWEAQASGAFGADGVRDDDQAVGVEYADASYTGPRQDVDEVVAEFAALGYCCIRTSAATGLGLDRLRAELVGRMTVLSGQSGVGKSTLLNKLQPGLNLATGEVSDESEKGRHTTTLARLLWLDLGGYVVDTPGIRTLDLWNVEPGELEAWFCEFAPLIQQCRFNDCHHTDEEGCAVRAAVERGEISPRRYFSYRKMLEELAAERGR